jgi:predicted nucleic acid-binding protein
MSRLWVVDASPLILLGKIEQVALLSELSDELIVPDTVVREVGAKPGGDRAITELLALPGVRLEAEVAISSDLAVWNLGRGESQVLALAGVAPDSRAVLDDLEARRCAQSIGQPTIGTIGLVMRAKRKGIIETARPVIEHLRRVGLYASDQLIERALAHLGE